MMDGNNLRGMIFSEVKMCVFYFHFFCDKLAFYTFIFMIKIPIFRHVLINQFSLVPEV